MRSEFTAFVIWGLNVYYSFRILKKKTINTKLKTKLLTSSTFTMTDAFLLRQQFK